MGVVFCSSSDRVLEVKLSLGWIFGFSCAVCSEPFKGTGDLTGKRDFGEVAVSGEEELGVFSSFELRLDSVFSRVMAAVFSAAVFEGMELRRPIGCGSWLLTLASLELKLEVCLRIPLHPEV